MRYTDVILSAFSSLRQHKLRAALTMLGVVIGVASVIAMVSIGAGARERVATQIRSLGSNLLVVIPGNITQGGVRLGFGATPTLSSEDANAIASEISSVQIAAPLSTAKGQAVAGGINWATNISMVEPSYLEARDWEIAEGRSFEGEELQRGAQVTLLGRTVLDKLFPDTDAVGTTMRIGKVPFKIIGILAAKGQSAFGQDQDDVIYIPLVTGQRLGGRNQVKAHSVSGIYVKVTDGESLIATQDDITDLLRQRHRLTVDQDDDFSVRNIADLTSAKGSVGKHFELATRGCRWSIACCRRHRHRQHHAGISNREDERDWYTLGTRCARR